MKILVCFDGSLHSIVALEKALEIYAARNAPGEVDPDDDETDSITILYVQPTTPSCLDTKHGNGTKHGCELTSLTERQFKIFAKKLLMPAVDVCKSFGGVRLRDGKPVSAVTRETLLYEPKILFTNDKPVSEVICEESRRSYDLLLMGRRGNHVGSETQGETGSTCSHVLQNVVVPVKVTQPPPPLRL
eukprot:TRINITY_DN26443_c0_g1_i1.p1 TRINITY_DN26443_c0_g1~~TRINITY_DN26443_c0_g1_i1.p1  ORF type:complete len:188 (-),score=35.14 TRINITY_DN26443_c0_g1_i1:44-607(-)